MHPVSRALPGPPRHHVGRVETGSHHVIRKDAHQCVESGGGRHPTGALHRNSHMRPGHATQHQTGISFSRRRSQKIRGIHRRSHQVSSQNIYLTSFHATPWIDVIQMNTEAWSIMEPTLPDTIFTFYYVLESSYSPGRLFPIGQTIYVWLSFPRSVSFMRLTRMNDFAKFHAQFISQDSINSNSYMQVWRYTLTSAFHLKTFVLAYLSNFIHSNHCKIPLLCNLSCTD